MMNVNYLDTGSGAIRQDELRDWSQAALNQLDKAYGYGSFRPGQLEAVNTILNGRDLVAVMPTGSGKSVCYQLPAMRAGHLTLVVSPLRALMRDQVQALQARGVAAALIDSGVTPKRRRSIYDMAHGEACASCTSRRSACSPTISPLSPNPPAWTSSPSTRRTACSNGDTTSAQATCASANSSHSCPHAPSSPRSPRPRRNDRSRKSPGISDSTGRS